MRFPNNTTALIILFSLTLCGFASVNPARVEASTEEASAAPDNKELQLMIEKAVSQKIRPLQREITELKEEIRFHDILGGIGYIFGITGIVFYFLGVRRRESKKRTNNTG